MVIFQIAVKVKAEQVEEFLRATLDDAQHTIQEPGNLRFNVLRQQDDPTRFLLFKVYDSEAALHAHGTSPYVESWRATVKDMFEEYTRTLYEPVFPAAGDWRKA